MNRMRFYLTLTSLLIALAVSSPAQIAKNRVQRAPSDSDRRIEELKGFVIAQQQQIEQQPAQVDLLKTQVQQLIDTTQQANAIAQKAQAVTEQAQTAATQAQQTAQTAQQQATQAASNADAAKIAVTATQTASQEEQKRLAAVENFVGRFRLTGDIRVRGDSFFQSYPGCNATSAGRICADRNRVRLRVRFGMEGKLNEDFVGGFAIANG